MKKICLLCLLCGLTAQSADIPFHPYRKAAGRYWDLGALYEWIKIRSALTSAQLDSFKKPRPLQEWIGMMDQGDGVHAHFYYVRQVTPDGLLVEDRFMRARDSFTSEPFLLVNHPQQASVVDGQQIYFLALKVGTFQYRDAFGATRTVAKYDYGIPYDPKLLAAEIAAERRRTNQIPQTNSASR